MAEREEITVGIEVGEPDTAIADRIGRHRSTVLREIKANGGRACLRAAVAGTRAAGARPVPPAGRRLRGPKSARGSESRVQEMPRTKKWSPEQIAHRLRKGRSGEPEWWVSHEAIYQDPAERFDELVARGSAVGHHERGADRPSPRSTALRPRSQGALAHQARVAAQVPDPGAHLGRVGPPPPGSVEIDLVGHEGGNSTGEYCVTVTATDIATAWSTGR